MDHDGVRRAEAYIARVDEACQGLGDFPRFGRPTDELGRGYRLLSLDRRTTIVYRQLPGDIVEILGVYYGGREAWSGR